MADIFREIDEEVRRDKALEFWKKHGNLLIGLAIAAVLATAGWRIYDHFETQKAQASGARFEAALEASRAGRSDDAEKGLAGLMQDGTSGYRTLARMRDAAEIGKSRPEEGVKLYDAIAEDSGYPAPLRDAARLRAALLLVDTASVDALKTRLQPLVSPAGTLAANAREILALASLKAGDLDGAGRYLDEIITDRSAPAGLRQRADLLMAIVRAGPVKPAS